MTRSSSSVAATPPDELKGNKSSRNGAILEARNLNQSDRKKGKLLQEISLYILPREVVSLVDLEEDSRSILVDILSGHRQPSDGQVFFTGFDMVKNGSALRNRIGFVPRSDSIHQDLTVFEVLDYAAQLRLPRGTNRDARSQRVNQVIADLELSEVRNQRVKALKVEQRKRVNIGTELLANSEIIFLDEPASGMNQNGEARLMRLLRKLANQGRSFFLITLSKRSAFLADKMIVLCQGRLVWFGPPNEGLDFFHNEQTSPNPNGRAKGFGDLLAILENASDSEAQEWSERYRASPAYKSNIAGQRKEKHSELKLDERPLLRHKEVPATSPASPIPTKVSALRQFIALSSRGLKLLRRDRFGLPLLLGAPLLAALIELFLADLYMYDARLGDPARIAISLGLLIFLALLFAGISWIREIQKEAWVIRRESQAGLKLFPYVLSKIWIMTLIALYQALVWTGIYFFIARVPGGLRSGLDFFITLALLCVIGGVLGLLASSLARTEAGAALLLALLIVPQLAFSGALLSEQQLNPLGNALRVVMPSRFAFEALVLAGGHIQDLQSDACLGANLLTKCGFPGIQRFQASDLAQAEGQIRGEYERYKGVISAGPNGLQVRWMALLISGAVLMILLAVIQRRKNSFV